MSRASVLFFSFLSLAGLAGCDTVLNGRIETSETFSMVDKKGRTFTVPAKAQGVKFAIEDSGRVSKTLKFQLRDDGGKKRKVELNVAADTIPDGNGDFKIEGAKVGQPFDLSGKIMTTESDSDPVRTYERCTFYVRQYRCWWDTVLDSRGYPHRVRRCGEVDVGYPGQREVEYHTHSTKVDASGNFLTAGDHSVAAWTAGASSSTTVMDSQGFCRGY